MLTQKRFIALMESKGWEPTIIRRYILYKTSGASYRKVLSFKDHDSFECDCETINADKIIGLWNENKYFYGKGS